MKKKAKKVRKPQSLLDKNDETQGCGVFGYFGEKTKYHVDVAFDNLDAKTCRKLARWLKQAAAWIEQENKK